MYPCSCLNICMHFPLWSLFLFILDLMWMITKPIRGPPVLNKVTIMSHFYRYWNHLRDLIFVMHQSFPSYLFIYLRRNRLNFADQRESYLFEKKNFVVLEQETTCLLSPSRWWNSQNFIFRFSSDFLSFNLIYKVVVIHIMQ